MYSRNCLHGALALLLLVLLAECAKRPMQEERAVSGILRDHYLLGRQRLEEGNWQAAADQFQLALSLNPEYVPAYEGLGLIHLEQGDFLKAQQYFEEARQRDDTYAPLYIGLGRVLFAQGDYQRALDPFQRALALEPGNADAFFYLGKTYANLGRYSQAEECFKKALDNDPAHEQASEAWAMLVRQRTPPGELPAEYVTIAKKPLITRADFAALLVYQLPLRDFCASGEGKSSVSDMQASWASEAIKQVVACGLMPVTADGEFEPRQSMTRRECALVVTEVLLKSTAEPRLTEPLVKVTSPFPDVPADHESFGAIMLATSQGIMEAKGDGFFHPDDVLNGHEAMKIMRALREQL
jgi:hypothetical protein